jgi:hypothetical protein
VSNSNGHRPKLDTGAVLKDIMGNPSLTQVERFLAVKILSHRDDYTGSCCPGQRELATYTGMSQPGVIKALVRLHTKGVLVMARGQQWERYGHGTNQYFFEADSHLLKTLVGVPENVVEAMQVVKTT